MSKNAGNAGSSLVKAIVNSPGELLSACGWTAWSSAVRVRSAVVCLRKPRGGSVRRRFHVWCRYRHVLGLCVQLCLQLYLGTQPLNQRGNHDRISDQGPTRRARL